MSTLTEKQAYAAMYYYLDKIWQRTKWDDLAVLLGDMSLLSDGTPADRAVSGDWKEAVNFALGGGEAGKLELKGKPL
jgi:hypothetical protein